MSPEIELKRQIKNRRENMRKLEDEEINTQLTRILKRNYRGKGNIK